MDQNNQQKTFFNNINSNEFFSGDQVSRRQPRSPLGELSRKTLSIPEKEFSTRTQEQMDADFQAQNQDSSDEGFSFLNTVRTWKDSIIESFEKKMLERSLEKKKKLNQLCHQLSPYCENDIYDSQNGTIPDWKIEEINSGFEAKSDKLEDFSHINGTQNRFQNQGFLNDSFETVHNDMSQQNPSFVNPHRIKRGNTLNTQIYPRNNPNSFPENYQSGMPAYYGTRINGVSQPQAAATTYYGAQSGGYTQGNIPTTYYGAQSGGYVQGNIPATYYGAQSGGYTQGNSSNYYGNQRGGYTQERSPVTHYGAQRIGYTQPDSEVDRNFINREQMYLDKIKSLQEDLDFERSFSDTFLRKRR